MRFATTVMLALMPFCIAPGQTQPSFEAAAIHPDTVGVGPGTAFDFNGTTLRVTNATAQYLIRSAWRVQADQIVGGPAWLDSDRFDIEARTGGNRLNTDRAAGKAVLTGTRVSMEQLSGYIGDKLSRVVIDKTEPKGIYDFTLEWDPEQAPGETGPSMFTGLREQLGLRLESQKTPVDVM